MLQKWIKFDSLWARDSVAMDTVSVHNALTRVKTAYPQLKTAHPQHITTHRQHKATHRQHKATHQEDFPSLVSLGALMSLYQPSRQISSMLAQWQCSLQTEVFPSGHDASPSLPRGILSRSDGSFHAASHSSHSMYPVKDRFRT